MADLTISIDIDARGTKKGTAEAKAALKEVGNEAEKAGRKMKSVAQQDIAALDKEAAKAAVSVKSMASTLGSLGEAGGPVGPIIAAIGVALLAVVAITIQFSKKVVELVFDFAKLAKEVKNASSEIGLSVTTMSALKFGMESTGGKLDEMVTGLKNFSKTIADANNGSKEASAKLVRLGIDGKAAVTDLDGAFRQALERIASMPAGVQRLAAATDAFGDKGASVIPMIERFGGNLDKLVEKARELGLTLSVDDVRAATDFDKSLAEVEMRVISVAMAFGRNFMPVVKEVLDKVGGYLKDNDVAMKTWADNQSLYINGLISYWERLQNAQSDYYAWVDKKVEEHPWLFARSPEYFRGAGTGLSREVLADMKQAGEERRQRIGLTGTIGGGVNIPDLPSISPVKLATRSMTPQISDEAKQAQDLSRMLKDLNIEIEFFGQTTEEAAMRQTLLKKGIFEMNQGLADQLIGLARDRDGLIASAKAAEEAADARKKYNETLQNAGETVTNKGFDDRNTIAGDLWTLTKQIELGRELNDEERQLIANLVEQSSLREELRRNGLTPEDINLLIEKLSLEQQLTLEYVRHRQELSETYRIQQLAKSLQSEMAQEIADLNEQIRVNNGLLPITRVQTLLMSDAYAQLNDEQRRRSLAQAQEIDDLNAVIKAQQEAQSQYEQMYGTIRDSLQVLADQGFGAFFKNILRKFQSFVLDLVTQWITSKFFKMFFQGGNQQAAQASGQGGGGIFGAIQNAIFGGGQRAGATPNFNPGATGGGGSGPYDFLMTGNLPGVSGSPSQSGGGLFGGGLSGTIGGIASLGVMAGGAIGGKWGGLISSVSGGALTGLMLGAKLGMIGGPVGAAIGAAAGFAMSILGGLFSSPKRKRDKNEKMPQLTQGFADALKQLRMLRDDKNAILTNPSGAMAKADELRAAIASGFGIQFESKKYSKIAQQQIAQKLAEADILVKQIKEFAEMGRAAGERDRRMLPEFANGVYMSPAFQSFRRRNGMLGGTFTGRDSLPSLLAPGEMVLNPRQMNAVRANAGFDVFKTAGIPGYAGGGVAQSQPMSAGNLNVTIVVEQDAAGLWHATAQSDAGQKVIAKVVETKYANDELKMKRR